MKIVFVDTTIHGTLIGGGQLFLPGLMKGLKEKGHEVHLVTKGEPNPKVAPFIHDSGATVHIKPWKKNGLVEDTAPLFARWINELQPDVYIVSVSEDIGWVVLPLIDPAIATLTIGHNDEETFYMPAQHYHSFLTRVIGVSHEINHHYASACNIPGEKIDWIPYGVPVNPATPADNHSGILKMIYVGRVVEEQKRVSDLILITKALAEKNIRFKLIIIGDGEAMPKVKAELEQQITEGKVELKGWLANTEIIKTLRQSEIFVLTSAYEGFCIALIEAIANGCCPIVTDIRSGNKELVKDAANGFVVPVGNIKMFTERLIELANDPARLQNMRIAAWKEGQQYSIGRMVENYERSFQTASAAAKLFSRRQDKTFPLMESCRSKYPNWARRLKLLVSGNN